MKEFLVGILSDTHGYLPESAFAALADCDHIIHAGDIGDPKIIRLLKSLAPVSAVLGNNDFDEYGINVGKFAHPIVGDLRFLLAHYPQDLRIGWHGGGGVCPGDPIPDICVHGHTHIPKIVKGKEARPASYIICPGSTSRPRGGSKASLVKLRIKDGKVEDILLEELER